MTALREARATIGSVDLRRPETMVTASAVAVVVDHLVDLWREVSSADRQAGAAWYRSARDVADGIADRAGITREQAAGLIAVTSPRCAWEVNVSRAEDAALSGSYSGIRDQVRKVDAILADDDVDVFDHVRGPKVTRFYRNILGDWSVVTVDIWAIRACFGDSTLGDADYKQAVGTDTRYRLVELAYQRAAARVHMAPAQFQAAIWVHVRERKLAELESLPVPF